MLSPIATLPPIKIFDERQDCVIKNYDDLQEYHRALMRRRAGMDPPGATMPPAEKPEDSEDGCPLASRHILTSPLRVACDASCYTVAGLFIISVGLWTYANLAVSGAGLAVGYAARRFEALALHVTRLVQGLLVIGVASVTVWAVLARMQLELVTQACLLWLGSMQGGMCLVLWVWTQMAEALTWVETRLAGLSAFPTRDDHIMYWTRTSKIRVGVAAERRRTYVTKYRRALPPAPMLTLADTLADAVAAREGGAAAKGSARENEVCVGGANGSCNGGTFGDWNDKKQGDGAQEGGRRQSRYEVLPLETTDKWEPCPGDDDISTSSFGSMMTVLSDQTAAAAASAASPPLRAAENGAPDKCEPCPVDDDISAGSSSSMGTVLSDLTIATLLPLAAENDARVGEDSPSGAASPPQSMLLGWPPSRPLLGPKNDGPSITFMCAPQFPGGKDAWAEAENEDGKRKKMVTFLAPQSSAGSEETWTNGMYEEVKGETTAEGVKAKVKGTDEGEKRQVEGGVTVAEVLEGKDTTATPNSDAEDEGGGATTHGIPEEEDAELESPRTLALFA